MPGVNLLDTWRCCYARCRGNTLHTWTVCWRKLASERRIHASASRGIVQIVPAQPKTAEILAQPVGVVWRRLARARDAKQPTAGLGKCFRLTADSDRLGKLHAIEPIQLGRSLGTKDRGQQAFAFIRRRTSPGGLQSQDLLLDGVDVDAIAGGKRRHPRDGPVQVAEVRPPRRRHRTWQSQGTGGGPPC